MSHDLLTGDRTFPVTLLTGFLGSGKTTLLREMLASPALKDTAVLINEFGDVGIDHLIVREVTENIVILDSGCLCCAVREDMITSLRDLYGSRLSGEVPPFDRVIVETSGLADPVPIIHTLLTDPELLERYRHRGTITVVDGCLGAAQILDHAETVDQVTVADFVVISKDDVQSEEELRKLESVLFGLNGNAPIVRKGALGDPASLPARVHTGFEMAPAGGRRPAGGGHDHHDDHDGHHHHHTDGITSVHLHRDKPVDWGGIADWLMALTTGEDRGILRLKGVLNVAGVERPIVVQGVRNIIYPADELSNWPEGPRGSDIVLIGKGLRTEEIEREFDLHQARATPMRIAS